MTSRIISGPFGLAKGNLPIGCRFCVDGLKSVIFITGYCTWPSWCSNFCPLSENRKNKDIIFVNEVQINLNSVEKAVREIKNEISLSKSQGASITGGEPLLVFKRTIWIISILKNNFGKRFHVHLYTNGELLTKDKIEALASAGLDEIRLHSYNKRKIQLLAEAKNYGLKVGLEYPLSPFLEKVIRSRILLADKLKLDFVNLNEFEATENTYHWLKSSGLDINKNGISIKGSDILAKRILSWSLRNTKNVSVHYCPFWVKDSVQYRNRLILRAKSVKKTHERITSDGTIIKAVLVPNKNECSSERDIIHNIKKLLRDYGNNLYVNIFKERLEFNATLLENENFFKKLVEITKTCYNIAIIEELPTYPRSELNITYINSFRKDVLSSFEVLSN
ncbi:MAG: radical SAM protein [Candidatus Asgardarchaeia archaeon]